MARLGQQDKRLPDRPGNPAKRDLHDLVGFRAARCRDLDVLAYALADGSRVIDVAHLEAAWALWLYCRESAALIFGAAIGDEVVPLVKNGLR